MSKQVLAIASATVYDPLFLLIYLYR